MAQIFISYAREDFREVKGIYQRLKDAGFTPWMDKVDLLPGQKWRPAIEKAIQRADFFILCLSNHSVKKRGFVQREIRAALDLWQDKLEDDIYLIPALLEVIDPREMPDKVGQFQWVELYEEDGWEQLLRALKFEAQRRGIELDCQEAETLRQEEEQKQKSEKEAQLQAEQRRQQEPAKQWQGAEEERKRQEQVWQREAAALQAAAKQTVKLPLPHVVLTPQPQPDKRARVFVIVAAVVALTGSSLWLAPKLFSDKQSEAAATQVDNKASQLPATTPATPDARPERVQVLRYALELKDRKDRVTTFEPVQGRLFRLHFIPRERGYLYVLSPDEQQVLRTFLTNQQLDPGSDFAFPGGGGWIEIPATVRQTRITVVFVPQPITQFSFLSGEAGNALTADQRQVFDGFRNQASARAPQLNESADAVTVTALKNDQPLVFDIILERRDNR